MGNDLSWSEFCTYLAGLMSDTPLGKVVAIRSETDQKVIKQFTSEQRRIHRDWKIRIAKSKENDTEFLNKEMESLSNVLKEVFGK